MLQEEKNKILSKRNVVSFFIIFLMVSSILAIWQGSTSSIPSYNGHKVILEGNVYAIKSDVGTAYGYTYPSSLESIPVDSVFLATVSSTSEFIILFDPEDPSIKYIDLLRSELAQRDLPTLKKSVGFGVTMNSSLYPYPVFNCTTIPFMTLFLRTANGTITQLYQDGNCLVLEAPIGQELVQVKDRFVYTLYGIME